MTSPLPMHPAGEREALLWAMTGLDRAMGQFAAAFADAADPQLTSPPAARAVLDDLARVTDDLAAIRAFLAPYPATDQDEGVA